MKVFAQILGIFIISLAFELFLPWWSVALAGFLVGYVVHARLSFLTGFVAITLLWLSRILLFEYSAATPLTEKVAHIFALPNHYFLIMITVSIGGIVGGMATLTGSLLRKRNN